jgi:arginine decarboxylase
MNEEILNLDSLKKDYGGILIGNRIPRDYFVTKGTGQSDIAVHAGSYHLALKSAGVEMCNIMTYSSILPKIANKIAKPTCIEHGAVMETIMSSYTSGKGKRATAGIIYAWLFDKKTNEKFGGLVCEHFGSYEVDEIIEKLKGSLHELYQNGFSDKYRLGEAETLTESFIPVKTYGTALVALCFVNYLYPIIKVGE